MVPNVTKSLSLKIYCDFTIYLGGLSVCLFVVLGEFGVLFYYFSSSFSSVLFGLQGIVALARAWA